MQAELSPEGLAARSERTFLRREIEDLRIEKKLLEKRTARDLQELRSLISAPTPAAPDPIKAATPPALPSPLGCTESGPIGA